MSEEEYFVITKMRLVTGLKAIFEELQEEARLNDGRVDLAPYLIIIDVLDALQVGSQVERYAILGEYARPAAQLPACPAGMAA